MYKIIGGDGREYGPVSLAQLQQWRTEGRINNQTLIQPPGSTDWKPLGEFPELSPAGAPPPPPTVPVKTSGLAITSLVLGCVGFVTCGLTALPGLILGILGLSKINKSAGALGGKGLAIAGISVSSAMLLILPIYAALMLPALANARNQAKNVQCQNNLKQIGLAFAMYAMDNKENLLPTNNWCDAIMPHVGNSTKIFQCASGREEKCSYAFNSNMLGKTWQEDADVVLVIDAPLGWNAVVPGPQAVPPPPHKSRYNVLFNDGRVETITANRLKELKWKPSPKPEEGT